MCAAGLTNQMETLEICPYNPAHTILKHRMQTHLHKCKKNYTGSDFVVCPFDSTHHMPRPEKEYHEQNCPSRFTFDKWAVKLGPIQPPAGPAAHPVPPPVDIPSTSEENWDDDSHPSYDPKVHAATKPVLRILNGAKPSERKAFRKEQRMRMQQLEDEEVAQGPIKTKEPTPPKPQSQTPEKMQPLRRPKEPPQAYLHWARGAQIPTTDAMTNSPGQPRQGGQQVPRVPEWMGLGRGRDLQHDASPQPPTNAWGRGRFMGNE